MYQMEVYVIIVDKTMRILTTYCLFRDCSEVEFRAITDWIPVSKKTVQRDIRFLEQAGLIRARFDRKTKSYIPMPTEGIQPVFPEKKNQRRYMERIIRLCYIIRHIDGVDDPIHWYEEQFPTLSARTRQRDFSLLNQIGVDIYYIPDDGCFPGHWVCEFNGAFSLNTLR